MSKPHIIILGCNFAGLTTARYIHAAVKDKADITIRPSTPAKVIAEDAGETILHQLLPMMTNMWKYSVLKSSLCRLFRM